MGKTRGHGSRRGVGHYRGRGGGRKPAGNDEEGSSEEEEVEQQPKQKWGQSATAGMMPPSSSDDEDDEPPPKPKPAAPVPRPAGQPATAGQMPPSSSEEEDSEEESEEESDEDEAPAPAPRRPAAARNGPVAAGVDAEQARKDMERLALIRQKREEQRLARIATEGFDRFAPKADGTAPAAPGGD